MTKYTSDYSTRFRILKGGRISMVVSAMLLGSSIIGSSAYAATVVSSNTTTAIDDDTVTVNSGKSVSVTETQASGSIDIYAIESRGTANINNNGTLTVTSTITSGGSSDSYSVATGVILDGSNGTVINNGEIIVNAFANNAVIQANNVDAAGIGISANATIENNNKITVRSSGFASGIGGDSGNIAITSIVNNGTIDVSSTNNGAAAIDLNSGSMSNNASVINNNILKSRGIDVADGIIAGNMQDHASVVNATNGIIDLAATNIVEDSVGIGATAMSNFASITNNGTITMEMRGASGAVGIGASIMNNDSSITNNNAINASNTDGNAKGIAVASAMNSNASIVNEGSIRVLSTGMGQDGAIGIYTPIMSNNTTIINKGTIESEGIGYADGISVDTMSGATSIVNEGTVKATKNGIIDKNSASISIAMSSSSADFTPSITNATTGKLYGNIVINGDVTLNNAGLISLPYNANSTAEYQPTIPNFTNTGTLEIGAKKTGGIITNSQLMTNTATFDTGSKIHVNVVAGSQPLVTGERLSDVVTAQTSLTVNDLTVDGSVEDTSALLNFTYEINKNANNQNTIDLIASQAQTIVDAVTDNNPTPTDSDTPPNTNDTTTSTPNNDNAVSNIRSNKNVKNAAAVLMAIQDIPTMGRATSVLQSLSTNQAIVSAVESATPAATAAITDVLPQLSRGLSGIVSQRQNATLSRGFNSGDEVPLEKNLWVKPFGSLGEQQNKDGINGFDLTSYGIGMGVDGEYSDGQNIGLALFYTRANVDVNNMNQQSDMDIYSAMIYGNNLLMDNKTSIAYQIGYSAQKTSLERQVFTGDKASAQYTSETLSADLKLRRGFKVSEKVIIEPKIETTYRYYINPSYNENGAGALNLHVNKFTSSEWIGGIGVTTYYNMNDTFKMIMGFAGGYDFRNDARTVTSSFEGASGITFDTDGIDNGRWSYEASLELQGEINEVSHIDLSYSYQGQGKDFTNHTVAAKYMHKF